MLQRESLEVAVYLQDRCYRLLLWMQTGIEKGFISAQAAHQFGSFQDSARAWIEQHYHDLPSQARPEREYLGPFSRLFSTYLQNSFDLDPNPGEKLHSPGGHCFCPMCSWMVRINHLRPKKVTADHKQKAKVMQRGFILSLSAEIGMPIGREAADGLAASPEHREASGLCAYAVDLMDRMEGVAIGPVSLVLWRTFAWNRQGSPKKDVSLSVDGILAAQAALCDGICALLRD